MYNELYYQRNTFFGGEHFYNAFYDMTNSLKKYHIKIAHKKEPPFVKVETYLDSYFSSFILSKLINFMVSLVYLRYTSFIFIQMNFYSYCKSNTYIVPTKYKYIVFTMYVLILTYLYKKKSKNVHSIVISDNNLKLITFSRKKNPSWRETK